MVQIHPGWTAGAAWRQVLDRIRTRPTSPPDVDSIKVSTVSLVFVPTVVHIGMAAGNIAGSSGYDKEETTRWLEIDDHGPTDKRPRSRSETKTVTDWKPFQASFQESYRCIDLADGPWNDVHNAMSALIGNGEPFPQAIGEIAGVQARQHLINTPYFVLSLDYPSTTARTSDRVANWLKTEFLTRKLEGRIPGDQRRLESIELHSATGEQEIVFFPLVAVQFTHHDVVYRSLADARRDPATSAPTGPLPTDEAIALKLRQMCNHQDKMNKRATTNLWIFGVITSLLIVSPIVYWVDTLLGGGGDITAFVLPSWGWDCWGAALFVILVWLVAANPFRQCKNAAEAETATNDYKAELLAHLRDTANRKKKWKVRWKSM